MRRRIRAAATLLLAALFSASCNRDASTHRVPPTPTPEPVSEAAAVSRDARPVQIEMKNVRLHAAEGVILEVAALRGEMVSRQTNRPPVFDDQNSYVLNVFSAEIAMDMASLTHLMNDYLFAYEGSPLRNITVEIDEGRLKQKATLHKGLPLPISLKATASVTSDGRLKLTTQKVSTLGVPSKSLMHLFGLELDELIDLKDRRGIELDGDDIILVPGQILPPPEMRGRLSSVEIKNGRLVQRFSPAGASVRELTDRPDPAARNYIFFSGSSITFGRLTMKPAQLQLIDNDPKDPFDFYPAKYEAQLIAGYSKNIPSGGLKTYMPDLADLTRTTSLRPPSR